MQDTTLTVDCTKTQISTFKNESKLSHDERHPGTQATENLKCYSELCSCIHGFPKVINPLNI